jgi:hypothetical protein
MTEEHDPVMRARPREEPPAEEGVAAGPEASKPNELSAEELALTRRDHANEPPAEPAGAEAQAVAQQNKRVNALWTQNEPRNSWLSFADLGWRKIMPSTESGVVALSMLGAHAKQTQCRVDFAEDAQRVVSLYCWR